LRTAKADAFMRAAHSWYFQEPPFEAGCRFKPFT
jgi:hypothetical protein